jgi:hypothetical protein
VRLQGDALRDPFFYWGLGLAAVSGVAALVNLANESNPRLTPAERMRVVLLGLGGGLGCVTTAFGLFLPFLSPYKEVFGGGFEQWRKHAGTLATAVAPTLGGLVLMFLSLQLARGVERENALLRRLLYGFNAVLGGLVLAAVLALLNIFAYAHLGPADVFNRTFDWTANSIHTLSDKTVNTLTALDRPVTVYVLMPNLADEDEVKALIENCRGVTNQISAVYVHPNDREAITELIEKYQIPDIRGMLVVYEGDKGEDHEFIKYDDMLSRDPESQRTLFAGENALLRALVKLASGKPPVVYFTQGNGEPAVEGLEAETTEDGFGVVFQGLGQGYFDCRPLKFGASDRHEIPEDADIVVIARPQRKLADDAVKAIRDYMENGPGGKSGADDKRPKGKLVVLTDATTNFRGSQVETGLEGLLKDYNVRIAPGRILDANIRVRLGSGRIRPVPPNRLTVSTNPQSSNPVAKALRMKRYEFVDARAVQPITGQPDPTDPAAAADHPNPAYRAEALLQVRADDPMSNSSPFVTTDLTGDPIELAQKRTQQHLPPQTVTVATAVSEAKDDGMPRDPFHAGLGGSGTPRLIAFGSASWLTNREQTVRADESGQEYFDQDQINLLSNCLSWLRERPDVGTSVDPKKPSLYKLPFNYESPQASLLLFQPLGLLVLVVVALGCGVWMVRRR